MINVKPNDELFPYCADITNKAKNMFNVANYYIRNTMTGLSKSSEQLTDNEREVLAAVSDGVDAVNAKSSGGKKRVVFDKPTPDKWFLNYNILDAIFKATNNIDYRSHHAHVMQNAISDCCEAWKGYFASKKAFQADPSGFLGAPRIPGYVKTDHRTAVLSNLAARIKGGKLSLPKTKHKPDVSGLPHASCDKLIEVRITPYFDLYRLQLITDDGLPELTANGNEIPCGAGVASLDLGLDNFAAFVDNKGFTPIVIKGGFIKAANQWYNKRCSDLRGFLMRGHDPKEYYPGTTKQMNAISRRRDAIITDGFYKIAHHICRNAVRRELSYLICGKSAGWKQEINIGHKNNQEFVQIPHARFISILKSVARKYELIVIEQEESYTSKASFLDNDPIPVYGTPDADKAVFSGKRIKRGAFRSKEKIVLNADVNGAANIGRKHDPCLYNGIDNFEYLYRTVAAIGFRALNPAPAST